MSNFKAPLGGYLFTLEVSSVKIAWFTELSGLGGSLDVTDQRMSAAGGKSVLHRYSGLRKWENLQLKRGFDGSAYLEQWRKQVLDGKFKEARRDASVVIADSTGKELCRFNLKSCWPSSWKTSGLNSTSKDIITEELEMVYEDLDVVSKV